MKLHILHNLRSGPWGGGNQFLKALQKTLESQGVYEQKAEKAEVILFNSHHQLKEVLKIKSKFPQKIFIHRLGPVFYYHRGRRWKKYDRAIIELTNKISDGVVFQSSWSLQEALKLGFDRAIPHKVIFNAPGASFFNKHAKQSFKPEEKIKLVAMSWSSNAQKGFAFYQYLDQNLDFSKYEMTFIGNSPVQFKNIKMVKPLPPEKVAQSLKQNDIFIFAARNEACSNALIEALSCGLPAVALNSASNAEIVKGGGELFQSEEDMIEKLNKVSQNYFYLQSRIPEFSIQKAAHDYHSFAKRIFIDAQTKTYQPKGLDILGKLKFWKVKLILFFCRLAGRF